MRKRYRLRTSERCFKIEPTCTLTKCYLRPIDTFSKSRSQIARLVAWFQNQTCTWFQVKNDLGLRLEVKVSQMLKPYGFENGFKAYLEAGTSNIT